jgi:hypothetical protein
VGISARICGLTRLRLFFLLFEYVVGSEGGIFRQRKRSGFLLLDILTRPTVVFPLLGNCVVYSLLG